VGVISPLLSNIYLHVLDDLWMRRSAPLGTLVRYADDFVVMCRTRSACEQAEERIRVILGRLGLELHPDKTRRVRLFDGEEGFDFLGCHLHKHLSGRVWEKTGRKLYFLQRWPSQRSMQQIRRQVKELTPRWPCPVFADTKKGLDNGPGGVAGGISGVVSAVSSSLRRCGG
jgi:Retron-type reverse transcriptase